MYLSKRLGPWLLLGFYSSSSRMRTAVGSKAACELVQYTEEAPSAESTDTPTT